MDKNKASYFQAHKDSKEFHFAGDMGFFKKPDAEAHAKTIGLKAEDVVTHTRADYEEWKANGSKSEGEESETAGENAGTETGEETPAKNKKTKK